MLRPRDCCRKWRPLALTSSALIGGSRSILAGVSGPAHAVQGNLDPITLFAPIEVLELRVKEILRAAAGRPGHIFNLGHGIVPETPVENVQAVVGWCASFDWRSRMPKQAVLLLAHGTPETIEEIPDYLRNVVSGRPLPEHVIEEIKHRYSLIGRSPLTEITAAQGRLVEAQLVAGYRRAGLRWHAKLEALHPRRGSQDARGRRDRDRCHLHGAAEFADQRGLYKRAVQAEAGALKVDFTEAWARIRCLQMHSPSGCEQRRRA